MKQVVLIFGLFICCCGCQNEGDSPQGAPGRLSEPGMKSFARDTANSTPTLTQRDSIRNSEAADDTLTSIGKELNASKAWKGMFRYMADAAYFTSCEDGVKYTVNGGKAYLKLEKAYLAFEPDGKPFLVTFKATAVGVGRNKSITIDEFIEIKAQNHCP